jgi:hypothetical protein
MNTTSQSENRMDLHEAAEILEKEAAELLEKRHQSLDEPKFFAELGWLAALSVSIATIAYNFQPFATSMAGA